MYWDKSKNNWGIVSVLKYGWLRWFGILLGLWRFYPIFQPLGFCVNFVTLYLTSCEPLLCLLDYGLPVGRLITVSESLLTVSLVRGLSWWPYQHLWLNQSPLSLPATSLFMDGVITSVVGLAEFVDMFAAGSAVLKLTMHQIMLAKMFAFLFLIVNDIYSMSLTYLSSGLKTLNCHQHLDLWVLSVAWDSLPTTLHPLLYQASAWWASHISAVYSIYLDQ